MLQVHYKVTRGKETLFDHTDKFELENKDGSFSVTKEKKMLASVRRTKENLLKTYIDPSYNVATNEIEAKLIVEFINKEEKEEEND